MADYKNCTCIACRNEFEPDDDIVVCPDCGTPYHRDCWHEHGRCINDELHAKGEAWKNPNAEQEKKDEQSGRVQVICGNCGERNDAGNIICTHCGRTLESENPGGFRGNQSGWQGGIPHIMNAANEGNPNEDMDGVSLQEVTDFVGKNTAYYIPRFRFFRDQKKKIMPNFVCIIFPELWFAYRKMWLWTLLVLVVSFILNVPNTLISMAYQIDTILASVQPQLIMMGEEMGGFIKDNLLSFAETIDAHYKVLYWVDFVCSYLSLAMHILLFLFGNYLYYRHSIKKIKAVREDKRTLIDLQSRIRMAGGTNIGFIFLALLIEFSLQSIIVYFMMFV